MESQRRKQMSKRLLDQARCSNVNLREIFPPRLFTVSVATGGKSHLTMPPGRLSSSRAAGGGDAPAPVTDAAAATATAAGAAAAATTATVSGVEKRKRRSKART